MTKAASKHGILQWVCNNAGCSQGEMAAARGSDQVLFWQIYAVKDLEITKKEIQQAVASGYKGLALTVDAIQVGKRERDMRLHIAEMVRDQIILRELRGHFRAQLALLTSKKQETAVDDSENTKPASSISATRPYYTTCRHYKFRFRR